MSSDETHGLFATQAEFASHMPQQGSPPTEFRLRPDAVFLRKFFSRRLLFPDNVEFDIWGFESESSGRGLPAPPIRVQEGQLVHVTMEASKAAHTIHLHGIEPDPRNDGVGHTSFEVKGSYTYQWRPQVGVPGDADRGAGGTYFYHCHVNTVLHVQMGLFGPLVIDPVVHPAFPTPDGTRRSFNDGPLYDIATEQLIVPFAVDPRWHRLAHAAGLSGEDVGLDSFDPSHYYALGGLLAEKRTTGGVWSISRVVAKASGTPTLLRFLNATYLPTRVRFTDLQGRPVPMAEAIAHDGRPFRDTSDRARPSPPLRDTGHPLLTPALAFGSAERYDALLHPPGVGEFRLHVDFHDWATLAVRRTLTYPLMAT